MGNHYDPRDYEDRSHWNDKGHKIKETVKAIPPDLLAERLNDAFISLWKHTRMLQGTATQHEEIAAARKRICQIIGYE